MAIKNLIVYADAAPAAIARLDVALDLARDHDAHLTALYVVSIPYIPAYIAGNLPKLALDMQEALLHEEGQKIEKIFREKAREAGREIEWREARGDLESATLIQARHADLAIVSQAGGDSVAESAAETLPETLIMGAGRPVLVVPRFGQYPKFGQRALIAWNGSREAVRAVNDALPLLRRAQQVWVLSADPADHGTRRHAGADIALHLARHGVKAEASTTHAEDIDIGNLLLSRTADMGADLVVMGAYGHSRTREIVLGGATRHLLQHMTVPVLFSH
ncbi:MAG: universal stress protein [Rhodospirillales bacterium]|nr:universal stress protein [Rhodospirillales bacterium]